MTPDPPPDVRLNIGTLAIDGLHLSARDAAIVKASMQAELARLLAASSSAAMPATMAHRLVAPPINLRPGQSPKSIGQSIAAGVFGGISR